MGGQPVRIGPFKRGLNNTSQAGESSDDEVVELVNFDLALDTSLVSRPPIEIVGAASNPAWAPRDVLGVYRVTAADWYVIVNEPTGATTWEVRAYPLGNMTGTSILIKGITGLANRVVTMVQYNDYAYFNVGAGATDTGFRWKYGNAPSSIATMPRGSVMVSWKDRLWITNTGRSQDGNYVWFSAVDATGPHPETWNTSVDFFSVDPGLGGLNTALFPLRNSLLIFKEDATHIFEFTSSVAKGNRRIVSPVVGAAGPSAVAGFENYCFVYDQGRIYELQNYNFDQINLNVNFNNGSAESIDATAPGIDLSIINRRLLVRYNTSIFSYSVDTKTWSEWTSVNGTPSKFIELPSDSSQATPRSYLAASVGATQNAGNNTVVDPGLVDTTINGRRAGYIVTSGGTGSITAGTKIQLNKSGAAFPEVILTKGGTPTDFDMPVSPTMGSLSFSVDVLSATGTGCKVDVVVRYLNKDGTTTVNVYPQSDTTVESKVFTGTSPIPTGAIMASLAARIHSTASVGDMLEIGVRCDLHKVANTAVPRVWMQLVDQYQNTLPKEYIDCYIKTKAYDYQANSVFKRLFLWGADLKTPRDVYMWAIPLGKKFSVTWADMEAYTWGQLEAGTWENPLSWQNQSHTVSNILDAVGDISENGRFFAKAPKSLRFRQIQYALRLSTLGNQDSGPAKVFSLTTYTTARQLVVAEAT